MHHTFFIHSSVNGHLGCLDVLAIVINATLNVAESLCGMLTYISLTPFGVIAVFLVVFKEGHIYRCLRR